MPGLAGIVVALAFADPSVGSVTLHVGVPISAGGVADLVADGAAGQCSVSPSRLVCPAKGPVTFRWGPGGDREVLGRDGEAIVLDPGETGMAFALSSAERADLHAKLDTVSHSPDPKARQAALIELQTWGWRSGLGPLQPDAPVPFPPGWLSDRAADPDWGVRRIAVFVARDLRTVERSDVAESVLLALADDPHPRVARAALASLSVASAEDLVAPEVSWQRAVEAIPDPGARGRAAIATLARLSKLLEAGGPIDPRAAVRLAVTHHPEQSWRLWAAWKDEVPFDAALVDLLFRNSAGLSRSLLRFWGETEPAGLAGSLRRWEPIPPHSPRWTVAREWLSDTQSPDIRSVFEVP